MKKILIATALLTASTISAAETDIEKARALALASPAEVMEIAIRDYTRQCLAVSGDHISDMDITSCIFSAVELADEIARDMAENILDGNDD